MRANKNKFFTLKYSTMDDVIILLDASIRNVDACLSVVDGTFSARHNPAPLCGRPWPYPRDFHHLRGAIIQMQKAIRCLNLAREHVNKVTQ